MGAPSFSAATSDQEGRPRRDAPTGRLDFSQPRNDPSITRALDRVIRPTHQRRVRIRRIEPIQQIIQAAPSALLQLSRRGWRRLSELRIKRLSDLVLRIFKVQSQPGRSRATSLARPSDSAIAARLEGTALLAGNRRAAVQLLGQQFEISVLQIAAISVDSNSWPFELLLGTLDKASLCRLAYRSSFSPVLQPRTRI